MPLYCHSCSMQLRSNRVPPACSSCGAIFGSDLEWAPTSRARDGRHAEAQAAITAAGAVPVSGERALAFQREADNETDIALLQRILIAGPLMLLALALVGFSGFVCYQARTLDGPFIFSAVPGLITFWFGYKAFVGEYGSTFGRWLTLGYTSLVVTVVCIGYAFLAPLMYPS